MKRLRNYVGGAWVAPAGLDYLETVDPSTEDVVALVPAGSQTDADAAVAAAKAGQASWAATPLEERVALLDSMANAIEGSIDDLSELEHQEMGKPREIARMFIGVGLTAFREGLAGARTYGFVEDPVEHSGGRSQVIRHPIGVVAKIVPWNFTVAQSLLGLAAILASGNTVVIKPSEKASLSAQRMFEVIDLPPGVVNLLNGDRRAGEPLSRHPDVGLVHLTGSVATGRSVAVDASRKLHRTVLELGGNDAVIVDSDVSVTQTAAAVAVGAFINSGQICTSMERIYVHRSIYREFAEALAAEAKAMTDSGALGPLVDQGQRAIVAAQVDDALGRGARALVGGGPLQGRGYFYPATVLVGVPLDCTLMQQETFGPVAPLIPFDDFDEALAHAADGEFGLAATVFSNNADHIERSTRLPVGVLWVNEWQGGSLDRLCEPAGISGSGAAGGRAAFDASTRPSTVFIAHPRR